MLPAQYRWLETEPGPRMIIEALKEIGLAEAPGDADNPKIIGWQDELEAAELGSIYAGVYRHDAIPWCGLFMAVIAHRANTQIGCCRSENKEYASPEHRTCMRRPERNPPRLYLSALEWASFGTSVPKGAAALGDVLVFKRPNRDVSRFGLPRSRRQSIRSRDNLQTVEAAPRGGAPSGLSRPARQRSTHPPLCERKPLRQ